MALRTASSRASLLKGFPRKAMAPACRVRRRASSSPCAVRMTAGIREQVEAAHPGHPQIEDQAAGVLPMNGLEEGLRGHERLDLEADRCEEISDGSTE
jgi:hypothetical protein